MALKAFKHLLLFQRVKVLSDNKMAGAYFRRGGRGHTKYLSALDVGSFVFLGATEPSVLGRDLSSRGGEHPCRQSQQRVLQSQRVGTE